MNAVGFSESDLLLMRRLSITESQVMQQIEIFQNPSCHIQLAKRCTIDDGVNKISQEEAERYINCHREAAGEGRFMKFVPASGAATRMFKAIFRFFSQPNPPSYEDISRKASEGDAQAREVVKSMDEIRRFPFFEELRDAMRQSGFDIDHLIRSKNFKTIFEYLTMDRGLNYGGLPKGLLKFHKIQEGSRSAFEEHLVDSAYYLKDADKSCRLHFTVSPEHEQKFRALLENVRSAYERMFDVCYKIDFSYQHSSTNTVAVDKNNLPFRNHDGSLLFRPAGHGALLENLNALNADLVYIRNIDNVAIDEIKGTGVRWKRILGGYLVEKQREVHRQVRSLRRDSSEDVIDSAARFANKELLIQLPAGFTNMPAMERKSILLQLLNRPMRVCGVVENTGEPGGAPFWTIKNGYMSLQIVEKAQVDFRSLEQEKIWMSSTHFNPVDIVCGLLDSEGKSFDLRRHVDPNAVFISNKSLNGMDLKALELPGLWNGAMSDWITLFVEVPKITFNPVKTVNDLLRPEHQWSGKIGATLNTLPDPTSWTDTQALKISGERSPRNRTESASARAAGA